MQEGREVQGKSGTGIIPNIIYYLWCYGWWKGLQLGITALCSYCHSAIPHPDVINGYWFRKRGCSRGNLNMCDFSFFTLVPNALEPSEIPLKGLSQPHLCFCLPSRVWLFDFIWSMSKKITVKLLKVKEHTFRNTT